jgi:hypothetical protein
MEKRRTIQASQAVRTAKSLARVAQFWFAAPEFGGALIVVGNEAFTITSVDGRWQEREQLTHPLVSFAQCLLGESALRNVPRKTTRVNEPAFFSVNVGIYQHVLERAVFAA